LAALAVAALNRYGQVMAVSGNPLSEERGSTIEACAEAVPCALVHWTPDIDSALRGAVPGGASLVGRMASYHLGWLDAQGRPTRAMGKNVRSNLCCWAAQAAGGDWRAALPAACAIELLHNFTLVHDDVQDGDQQRRGRPTVWSIWGTAQAINAGDGLFALGLKALQGQEVSPPPEALGLRFRVAEMLIEAVLQVIEGQCLDLQHECQPETSQETYLRLVEAKTGALIGASLEAGAVMAGASAGVCSGLRKAGRLLGIAFQLRDDWLGVWGEPAQTGKSQENDLARRKLTHPVVAAYEKAEDRQRHRLRELYRNRGPEQEGEIRSLLLELGGPDLTAGDAGCRAALAVAEVERCGLAAARVQEFADVARYVAERTR
jgi:geranylgeranyl diphosphate synthase type I